MLWQRFLPDPAQALQQQKELTLLAMCIWGEARGASELAQQAVGFVVRNRVAANQARFGSGWSGVLLKPCQFSAFNLGTSSREYMFAPLEHDSERAWRSCFASALIAYEALYSDPTDGALFYYSGKAVPVWAVNMTENAQLDDFVFLTDRT